MSYEKDIPTKIKCPCGKGFIIKESESNDWGQTREYDPYIDCKQCNDKFSIVKEYFCPKPKHDYTIYYLVDVKTQNRIKLDL